jgi:hypothetical protein
LSVLVAVFGAALFAAQASGLDTQPVTVRIVETEDPEGDFDVGSPADFYARIMIGSNPAFETSHQSFPPELGTGFIFPWIDRPTDWVHTRYFDPAGGSVSVQIQMRDEDSGLPGDDDDVVDVKPSDGETLQFAVDLATGAISGDVTGNVGTEFDAEGTGDDGARITVLVTFDDPNDADRDGLLDSWETSGHPDGLNLAAMGASPQRKDLFVELDCLAAADHVHCPTQQAVQIVVQSFANAPVQNLDGTIGIQLHVDVGTRFGSGVTQVAGTGGVTGTFGNHGGGGELLAEAGNTVLSLRPDSSNPTIWDVKSMAANRADVFRYGLFAHQVDFRVSTGDCTSGWGELPGNDFFVSLGGLRTATTPCWTVDAGGFSVGSNIEQAGTLMHELGHTLNLGHGGGDGNNNKPNYLSVMNYRDLLGLVGVGSLSAQFCGVPANTGGTVTLPGGCDYSRVDVDLTELAPGIDECDGIDGGGLLNFGPLDLDANGLLRGTTCTPSSANVIADVNGNGGTEPLPGWLDWDQLLYRFQTLSNFVDGAAGSADGSQVDYRPEDLEAVQTLVETQTAPDLVLSIDAPDAVPNGTQVTASLEVENGGLGPAFLLQGGLDDPDGTEIASISQNQLNAGETTPASSGTFTVPADACPSILTFAAEATGFGLAHIDHVVTAEHELEVLDVDAPTVEVSLSPTTLWPPNHTMRTIRAAVSAEDRCDPDPVIRLVRITANQPVDVEGDGSTAPDIDRARFGTADLSFRLRAERAGSEARIYTVVYSATDASGNIGYGSATVTVPGNQG